MTAIFLVLVGLVILLVAMAGGIILWILSGNKREKSGKLPLGLALLAPLFVYFVHRLFMLMTDGRDDPGSWFLTNAFNPLFNWTPIFKTWGFLLFVLAFALWFSRRLVSKSSSFAHWAAVAVRVITAFLLVASVASMDWSDIGVSRSADAVEEASFVYQDNGNLTANLNVTSPHGGATCSWKILNETGDPVPGIKVNNGCTTVTTPVLPAAGKYNVVLSVARDGVEMATAAKTIQVVAPGQQPANGDQTIANGCPETWVISSLENPEHRFVKDGVASIQNAFDHKSDTEARAAALDRTEIIKVDPTLFQFEIEMRLGDHVERRDLVSGGCASSLAASYRVKVLDVLKDERTAITAEEAPATGYNTGYVNGKVVRSTRPGITGNRAAIKVVVPGRVADWDMARCGQVVFVGNAPVNLPEGQTDEKEVEAQAAATTTPPASSSSSSPTSSASSSSSVPAGTTSSAPSSMQPAPGKDQGVSVQTAGSTDTRNQGQDTGGTWNNGTMSSSQSPASSSAPPPVVAEVPAEVGTGSDPGSGASSSPGTDWSGCNPDGSNC